MTRKGFTLVELLVVVAVIGILAGIAVVNLLQAHIRAKVSRCMADMKAVANAFEAYRVDHNTCPIVDTGVYPFTGYYWGWLMVENGSRPYPGALLTSPVAYLSRIPSDVFPHREGVSDESGSGKRQYSYWADILMTGAQSRQLQSWIDEMSVLGPMFPKRICWLVHSPGPDGVRWGDGSRDPFQFLYDPTNGTVSKVEISLCDRGWIAPRNG